MQEKKCLVCGGSLKKSKIKGLVKCCDCGFVTADLNIPTEELKKYYSKNYFLGEEYADYIADKEIIQYNFNKRMEEVLHNVTDSTEKSLFEIGCAYGFFLEVAAPLFKDVEGIDISQDAVEWVQKNLKVKASFGDYKDYQITKQVDVVCMWDTIEHLATPDIYINKASEHLKKGGMLFVSTGDIESFNARMRGKSWRQIHPPTHLHYFSPRTMRRLLEKNGFKVIKVLYPSNHISINTIAYTILVLRLKWEKVYNVIKNWKILRKYVKVNLHDFMLVIAEKN